LAESTSLPLKKAIMFSVMGRNNSSMSNCFQETKAGLFETGEENL